MADVQQRMRVRKGRVMHVVELDGMGWYRSVCRRRVIRGSSATTARAYGPVDEWSAELWDYPDCPHCPASGQPPSAATDGGEA